jgi:5-methylcytosine-specific restriction protein A
MRRERFDGGLGKPLQAPRFKASRGGTWTRTAKHHKAVHPQCAHCGAVHQLETDHIKPLHQGGTNEWRNLQSLCLECHARKTANEQRAR